jgi:hypothetical protein
VVGEYKQALVVGVQHILVVEGAGMLEVLAQVVGGIEVDQCVRFELHNYYRT